MCKKAEKKSKKLIQMQNIFAAFALRNTKIVAFYYKEEDIYWAAREHEEGFYFDEKFFGIKKKHIRKSDLYYYY